VVTVNNSKPILKSHSHQSLAANKLHTAGTSDGPGSITRLKNIPRSISGFSRNAGPWCSSHNWFCTWLEWRPFQAVLFDLEARRSIFGQRSFAAEFIYLSGILVISALSLLKRH
jgi:hypothetical protein